MKNPNEPKNAVANRELTGEFRDKWDLDLATIDYLQAAFEENGGLLIIRGGLATEAFAGGTLTRAHNDIDAQFLNSSGLSPDKIFKIVEKIIESEKTKWTVYHQGPEKIELREAEDERPFFNRRRLELKIVKEAPVEPEKRSLFSTNGHEIKVTVPEFYDFVSGKIRKLFMVNNRPEEAERETNLSDYIDLHRLISLPHYDKEKTLDALAKHFRRVPDPVAEAKREYDYIMELLKQL